jgi:hypothetical protein
MSMLRPSDENPTADDARRGEAEYDALAELFLGDEGAAGARLRLHDPSDPSEPDLRIRRDPERPTPTIEALVLGHLPVLAGPWVAQYARFLADERREAVALVRIAGDQASIDLYSDTPRASRNAAPDLDHALDEAAPLADRWIFRVDATSEPSMAACEHVDAVTLLCGADDAAIVSAYRTIKRVLAPAQDPDDIFDDMEREPAPSGPLRRVVIIGAPEEKAREAAEKLRRAAEAFLDARIETVVGPARLGPSSGATLYRGGAEGGPEAFAAHVRNRIDDPDAISSHPAPAADPVDASPRTTQRGVDVSEAPVPAPGLDPAALDTAAPAPAGARLTDRVPGLRRLPVACPYDDTIELAVDGDRRLHLLASYSPVACRAMAVVGAWAHDHSALLDALVPGGAFDATLDPTRHLFVERPAEARRLLDTDYRVHLLAPVVIEGKAGWYCAALNDE